MTQWNLQETEGEGDRRKVQDIETTDDGKLTASVNIAYIGALFKHIQSENIGSSDI